MKKYFLITLFFLTKLYVFAELPVGEVPPKILLEGDFGGRLDGTKWSSEELISGKITILFYVVWRFKNFTPFWRTWIK